MADSARRFVPAAGHDWLLPFYDPLQRLLGSASIHDQIVDRANLREGYRVLDIGCGTGTLAVTLARLHPEVEVIGIDPDAKALSRARTKAERAGVTVRFDKGFADLLPYETASFNRVLSSFMYHHLPADKKKITLLEVRRVLRPGGRIHLVDFGGSGTRSDGWIARLLHRSEHLHDNLGDRIPAALSQAGFEDVREIDQRRTIFGSITHVRGRSPVEEHA